MLGPDEMAAAAGTSAAEIVRLESVFEQLATDVGAAAAVRTFPEVLAERTATAAGLKSVVAYRFGFDFAPDPPAPAEAVAAAGAMLATAGQRGTAGRRPDLAALPALERRRPRAAAAAALRLRRPRPRPAPRATRCCSPASSALVEPRGVDVLLLHCYPYHRQAGYLAQVFPHVYFDVGLAVNHTGLGSAGVVAESLELAPFAKILFSSDA